MKIGADPIGVIHIVVKIATGIDIKLIGIVVVKVVREPGPPPKPKRRIHPSLMA